MPSAAPLMLANTPWPLASRTASQRNRVRTQALAMDALRAGRLDLRSFCQREGLDFECFREDFTRRIGQSPGQYRIRRRMKRACILLEATRDQISVIATQLGYASPYEFSAQFRQWMGVSPQAYRGGRASSS